MEKEPSARERRGLARAAEGVSWEDRGDIERGCTEVECENDKQEKVGSVVEVVDPVWSVEEARGGPGGSLVKEDALGHVVVTAVWAVVGEVKGTDGQHRP